MEATPAVERVLKLAEIEAERSGDRFISADHLLIGIMLDGTNFAALALKEAGFEVEKLRKHETPSK